VAIYYDSPATEGRSLANLLACDDVAAVDVVLPILHQPVVVEQALRAGKHVLSEKPVTGVVEGPERLIQWYKNGLEGRGGKEKPLWGLAENFRYMESLRYTVGKVGEVGGELVTFRLWQNRFVKTDNKYWKTECKSVLC
jgi:hypothetical protein